jgi:hypothetical protein
VEAFLVVLGIVVGALATLVTGFLQDMWRRGWERETDSQRRIALRSEQAASDLLPVLDDIEAALAPHTRWDSDTDDELLAKYSGQITRLAVQVGAPAARSRLEDIASAITHTLAIAKYQGDRPSQVGRNCWRAGRNVASHILGGEALEARNIVDDYRAAIEQDQDDYEQMMAEVQRDAKQPPGDPSHPPT